MMSFKNLINRGVRQERKVIVDLVADKLTRHTEPACAKTVYGIDRRSRGANRYPSTEPVLSEVQVLGMTNSEMVI